MASMSMFRQGLLLQAIALVWFVVGVAVRTGERPFDTLPVGLAAVVVVSFAAAFVVWFWSIPFFISYSQCLTGHKKRLYILVVLTGIFVELFAVGFAWLLVFM